MPTVLYCHGFLSSPQSTKAVQVQQWLAQHRPLWHYVCPELSAHPSDAKATLQQLMKEFVRREEAVYCIGSSLGGYWATWLTEHYGIKSVLVNPAVAPHTRFQHFLGQTLKSYYSEQTYVLDHTDLQYLQACDCPVIRDSQCYCVLLQTGDETLDYRQAQVRYSGCKMLVEPGGSHSFDGFEDHLLGIIQFLEIPLA